MRVLHAHNYGHGNLGDDAMADNVCRKLVNLGAAVDTISTYEPPPSANGSKNFKSITKRIYNYDNILIKIIIVLSYRMKLRALVHLYALAYCFHFISLCYFLKFFKILPSLSSEKKTFIRAIKNADYYIRSGSGSLNDIWFYSSAIAQFTEAYAAHLYGAKVIFTGQGIGPINGKIKRALTKFFLRTVDCISLRDKDLSFNLIKSIFPEYDNALMVGDDAFDVEPEEISSAYVDKIRNHDGVVICIQFRQTDYTKDYDDGFYKKIDDALSKVSEDRSDILFVFLPMAYKNINDEKVSKKILTNINNSKFIIFNGVKDYRVAKFIVGLSDIAIGQSYHFGVFALSSGVPFIGVYSNAYYKEKMEGMQNWYGLSDLSIHADSICTLNHKVDAIIGNIDSYNKLIKKKNKSIKAELDTFFSSILDKSDRSVC
jgi:polysaccharide pyruvyl transferase WcaK-like protein